MDLSLRTDSFAADDTSWLASRHGLEMARPVTLDVSAFTAATHYPKGFIPSGMPLGKITANGLYGPYAGPSNEVQVLTITGAPTGGTFTVTFGGQTTAAIAYNATAAQVQAALEALAVFEPGDVIVTGGPGPATPYTLTFGGVYAGQNVAQVTATGAFTGGTTPAITPTTTTAGGTATASDGRETFVGHLLFGVKVNTLDNTVDVAGAMLEHGRIKFYRLPFPVDTAGRAAVGGRLIYEMEY